MSGKRQFTQQSQDIIFKLMAQTLSAALPARLGISLPRIRRELPNELQIAEMRQERLDKVFELWDRSILHLEFQTRYRRRDLMRFLDYDFYLGKKHQLPGGRRPRIYTIIIYGAGIRHADVLVDLGSLRYEVYAVFLGAQDSEATLAALRAAIAAGQTLTAEQVLDLVLLPLMRHRRPIGTLVHEAVSIAKTLRGEQRDQTIALLLGLANAFLPQAELKHLLEELMSTSLVQDMVKDLLEKRFAEGEEAGRRRGEEKGMQQGMQQGMQHDLRLLLTSKFGDLPESLIKRIDETSDLTLLRSLFVRALSAARLDEVTGMMP